MDVFAFSLCYIICLLLGIFNAIVLGNKIRNIASTVQMKLTDVPQKTKSTKSKLQVSVAIVAQLPATRVLCLNPSSSPSPFPSSSVSSVSSSSTSSPSSCFSFHFVSYFLSLPCGVYSMIVFLLSLYLSVLSLAVIVHPMSPDASPVLSAAYAVLYATTLLTRVKFGYSIACTSIYVNVGDTLNRLSVDALLDFIKFAYAVPSIMIVLQSIIVFLTGLLSSSLYLDSLLLSFWSMALIIALWVVVLNAISSIKLRRLLLAHRKMLQEQRERREQNNVNVRVVVMVNPNPNANANANVHVDVNNAVGNDAWVEGEGKTDSNVDDGERKLKFDPDREHQHNTFDRVHLARPISSSSGSSSSRSSSSSSSGSSSSSSSSQSDDAGAVEFMTAKIKNLDTVLCMQMIVSLGLCLTPAFLLAFPVCRENYYYFTALILCIPITAMTRLVLSMPVAMVGSVPSNQEQQQEQKQ